MATLQDTLHRMVDLLPWREESHLIAAHDSVDDHFAPHPVERPTDDESGDEND